MSETASAREPQTGTVIADRYELVAKVGEGGMGAVWRARHLKLESDVALKLMSPSIAAQPEALNRFLREARAAAKLTSLHVVKVYDYGVDDGTPFIVMELLRGESLRERIDREGALPAAAVARIMRHACRALSKAHREGIVHRDLKPENLFVAQQEEEIVKVLDFGVAKLSTTSPGLPTSNTRTGAVLGTPFYMSPEQARGIKAIDHRSDLWSLAVIAFECLIGRLPFDSEAFGDLVLKICTLPPPVPSSLASVPPGFDEWFARAVERDPDLRFQSVDEMFGALQPVLAPDAATSAPTSVAQTAPAGSATRQGALASTGADVTASQTLMGQVPKRGPSPRAWAGIAAVAVIGAGAALAFSLREPEAGGAAGEPLTVPAAAGVDLGTPGGAETAASPSEPEPASEPSELAAGRDAPAVAPASEPSGESEARGEVAPAEPEPPVVEKQPAPGEAAAAKRRRSVRRRAKPRPRPPAPRPAAEPARPRAGDLFSDPD